MSGKTLLALAITISSAFALSATTTLSTNIYEGLQSTPLTRASDQKSILLPSLWRSNTPFGVADEVAVCAFLRHFG